MKVSILLKSAANPETSTLILGHLEHKPTYHELMELTHRGITELWGSPTEHSLSRQAVIGFNG